MLYSIETNKRFSDGWLGGGPGIVDGHPASDINAVMDWFESTASPLTYDKNDIAGFQSWLGIDNNTFNCDHTYERFSLLQTVLTYPVTQQPPVPWT